MLFRNILILIFVLSKLTVNKNGVLKLQDECCRNFITRSQHIGSALACDIFRNIQPKYKPKAFLASPGLKLSKLSIIAYRYNQ